MYYIQLRFIGNTETTRVLGDDSIFGSDKLLNLKDVARAMRFFGFILKDEKSIVTQEMAKLHFLGHTLYGPRLFREDLILISLAYYQEVETQEWTTLDRVQSLFYDSGCSSLLMKELINFVVYKEHHKSLTSNMLPRINWLFTL